MKTLLRTIVILTACLAAALSFGQGGVQGLTRGQADQLYAPLAQGVLAQIASSSHSDIIGVGDSITANGVTNQNLSVGQYGDIDCRNWHMWISLLSGGRVRYNGDYATGGYKTSDWIATWLPVLQADAASGRIRPGTIAPVLLGTNDYGNLTTAVTLANLRTIYTALLNAGILPIACTLTPRNDNQNFGPLDAGIARLARVMGIPLIDFASLGTTSDGWPSGWNGDAIHPNAVGAKGMAQFAYTGTVSPLLTGSAYLLQYQTTNSDGNALGGNGLFLTDSNSDGVPDGVTWSGGTNSLAAGTGSIKGNVWTATSTGTAISGNFANAVGNASGDAVYFSARVQSTVKASGGSFTFGVMDNGATTVCRLLNWSEDIPAGCVFAVEVKRLSTGPCLLKIGLSANSGASFSLAQCFGSDLTNSGLVALSTRRRSDYDLGALSELDALLDRRFVLR